MSYAPAPLRFANDAPAPRLARSSTGSLSPERKPPQRGMVYVLTNPSYPGQVKVGATTRTAEHRRHELSRDTGVPTEFEIAFETVFADVWSAEKQAHDHLARYRVNGQREFFRCDVATAVQVIQQLARLETHDRRAVEDLKKQGVALLLGLNGQIKDVPRALELLGQASSMGSVWGSYYAGRAAFELSRDRGKSDTARSNHRHRAREFFLLAQEEVPASLGWIANLHWDVKDWGNGNRAWDAFVAATAAIASPSRDAMKLLLDYAEKRLNYPNGAARPWRNAAVDAHTHALIAECGPRYDRVKRALQGENVPPLPSARNGRYGHAGGRSGGRSSAAPTPTVDRMTGKPAALRALVAVLREPAGWVRDLCVWSPATALLIAAAAGCYALGHEGYAVLAGMGAAGAAVVRFSKSRPRRRWQRRYR